MSIIEKLFNKAEKAKAKKAKLIERLLKEGKITVEEAVQLLDPISVNFDVEKLDISSGAIVANGSVGANDRY